MSMLLNTTTIGKFKQLSTYVKRVQYTVIKNNFILTFLLEGCLMYQLYQVQYLQSHKPGFWGHKIIK